MNRGMYHHKSSSHSLSTAAFAGRTVRRRKGGKRKAVMLILAVMVTVFTMMCLSGFTGAGRREEQPVSVAPSRYYEVIRVKANDTLWDIASRCNPAGCQSDAAGIKATVQEIMQVNSMSSSRIYVGQQIAVPCFEKTAA